MRKIFVLSFMLIAGLSARADVTQLRIEALSGAESVHALSLIGKMVVGADELCLFDTAGVNLGCTPLRQIGKIVFLEDEPWGTEQVQSPTIQVYPNPTQNSLFIRGVEGTQTVRIFSMQGGLMLSAEAANGEAQLYVGGLQSGTYLLQIGAQVVKFIKE